MSRKTFSCFAAFLMVASMLSAQTGRGSYRIGPRDELEIKVFEVPELNVIRPVTAAGQIILPLVGPVSVEGLTEIELTERLKALLELKYVQRASVEVYIRAFRSRPITVTGQVRNPGSLDSAGRWSLVEALTAAGGVTAGYKGQIHVTRRAENGLMDQLIIPVDGLLRRLESDLDIPIVPGDFINVAAPEAITVYLMGEVGSPGKLEIEDGTTLLEVIASVGGLKATASKKITIRRDGPAGQRPLQLVSNYKKILKGTEEDPILEEGDVIIVKESLL